MDTSAPGTKRSFVERAIGSLYTRLRHNGSYDILVPTGSEAEGEVMNVMNGLDNT